MNERPDYLHDVSADGTIRIAPLESRLAQMLEETGRTLNAAGALIIRAYGVVDEAHLNSLISAERERIEG